MQARVAKRGYCRPLTNPSAFGIGCCRWYKYTQTAWFHPVT